MAKTTIKLFLITLSVTTIASCSKDDSEPQAIPSAESFIKGDPKTIAYYPFNGNADNALKSEYNGVLIENPQTIQDRGGNSNTAYSFDSGIGSSINFGKVPFEGGNYTFSFWINIPSTGLVVGSHRLLSKRAVCLVGDFIDIAFSHTSISPARIGVEIRSDSNGLGSTASVGSDNLPLGEWVHVAVTIDSDKRITTLYFNGEVRSENNEWVGGSQPVIFDQAADMGISVSPCIGSVADVIGFTGSLDDLAIFSRVLTSDEIGILNSK